jgi:hypothetical protein
MALEPQQRGSDRFGRLRQIASRFRRDEHGSYLIIMALAMPGVVGAAGLGTEAGIWYYRQQLAQSAADAAAISAATSYSNSGANDLTGEAGSVTASYGFADGANNVTVTVHSPPTSGNHIGENGIVEVIVQERRDRLLSAMFSNDQVTIKGRAVARANAGLGCLLALDGSAASAANVQGTPAVNLTNCSAYDNSNNASTALNVGGSGSLSALSVSVVGGISGAANISTTKGIITSAAPVPDPYAYTSFPSFAGCTYNNKTVKNTATLDPGVYCNGLQLNAGAVATLNPGIYYMDRGSLQVAGGATLTGSGVTIVFTSSTGHNYATATINGGASVSLTAPTSGSTAGIVMFGDRNMPLGTTFKFNGGSGQGFGGALYFAKGALNYAGGDATNTNCTQVIGDTVSFVGNSTLAINCAGYGTRPIGALTASLVE